ncbi:MULTISPECIES: hypothetical protein [unclassified Nocardia]|uniref:hypothetical protein n=1 Tax=unclassified Nocardia TaxID=2637762 RepID=UPI001CE44EAE|nr:MULTISPECIES: hypothetical protein [unclassified Nocardia]
MSMRTRAVAAPGRVARRAQDAERVKSGAAQRAYARRRSRAEQRSDAPVLPSRKMAEMTAGRIPFVAAIIALLGCGLALTLLLTTRAAEDSYQLSDARQTNRTLADERAALQREVEAADSAPELAARARELGMIPAKDPARLVVGPDGSITVIGKPAPAQGTPVPPLNVSPSEPAGPQAGNAQARGERVVPVPTTTKPPTPAPAQPADPAANAAAVPGVQPGPAPANPAAAPVNPAQPPASPAPPPPNSAPEQAANPAPSPNPAQPPANPPQPPANPAQPANQAPPPNPAPPPVPAETPQPEVLPNPQPTGGTPQ